MSGFSILWICDKQFDTSEVPLHAANLQAKYFLAAVPRTQLCRRKPNFVPCVRFYSNINQHQFDGPEVPSIHKKTSRKILGTYHEEKRCCVCAKIEIKMPYLWPVWVYHKNGPTPNWCFGYPKTKRNFKNILRTDPENKLKLNVSTEKFTLVW